jgi:hypothetical protein
VRLPRRTDWWDAGRRLTAARGRLGSGDRHPGAHALLYVEGGTSDANSPPEVARVLNASDAYKIRGFLTNDTHFNWADREIRFANKIAALTHGLRFVVDTRADGNRPLLNPHLVTRGSSSCATRPVVGSAEARREQRAVVSPGGPARIPGG